MKEKIMVSVVLISYNAEKYIKEAIESVVAQKVNFKYELLLADDCSKDNTLNIMKEYEKKYPEIIRILKREHNLGATRNQLDASLQSKGKYITLLEGDDYWISEDKLQRQVDFLEEHPKYSGVSHYRQGREDGKIIANYPTEIKKSCDITMDDFTKGKMKFPESATLYKNIYLDKKHKKDIEYLCTLHNVISDTQLCTYLLSLGKVYFMAEPLMAYRIRRKKGESNYNSTHKLSEIQMSYLDIYLKMDEFFDYKYSFYPKYKSYISFGFMYSIMCGHFKEAHEFIKKCPKKYKTKIILLLPITSVKILFKKIRRK